MAILWYVFKMIEKNYKKTKKVLTHILCYDIISFVAEQSEKSVDK